MSKITDFFSMTRRERVGTLVVLVMLASSILFSYCSKQWREREQPECKPSAEVFRKLVDSAGIQKPKEANSVKVDREVKEDSISSSAELGKVPNTKVKNSKSASTSENHPHQSANGGMNEVPSF